ncbi:MerR family transcriptional regulator [Deinococcus yavapaiensis]|uniref:DNA-binding transcriptional MerR regulator n=1 Tax=Deinococcus yavapaiensis KR-236 TaxID=694435 RepID=A0A318S0J5_9DEIO|nr:MerR family transcriptional regulator [Deinococcus yavapaiensis]PYE50505.1 DNA-binding transcriptional MerR regulator [Deinococcus yavapaiensis KR-236]
MPARLTISRFAVLTGLSAKTLRYYDDVDLLRPDHVDPLTGYRLYGVAQIQRAVHIRRWRELGVPIDEIRTLLDQPTLAREVLSRHEERLTTEIHDRQVSLAHLRRILQEDPMEYRVEQLPQRQILTIRTRLVPPHYEVIPEALRELVTYQKTRGYRVAAPSFFVHHNDDAGDGSLVEVCVPVEGEVEPAGRIEARTFQGGPAFVGRFVGPYDRTGAAYAVVVEEALRRGLRITGVTVEFYVKSVPDTPNPEEYETDIAFLLDESNASEDDVPSVREAVMLGRAMSVRIDGEVNDDEGLVSRGWVVE